MSRFLVNMNKGTHGDTHSNDKFKIGKHTYGTIEVDGNHLLDEMVVGNFCSIGPNVSVNVKGWSHTMIGFQHIRLKRFLIHGQMLKILKNTLVLKEL